MPSDVLNNIVAAQVLDPISAHSRRGPDAAVRRRIFDAHLAEPGQAAQLPHERRRCARTACVARTCSSPPARWASSLPSGAAGGRRSVIGGSAVQLGGRIRKRHPAHRAERHQRAAQGRRARGARSQHLFVRRAARQPARRGLRRHCCRRARMRSKWRGRSRRAWTNCAAAFRRASSGSCRSTRRMFINAAIHEVIGHAAASPWCWCSS